MPLHVDSKLLASRMTDTLCCSLCQCSSTAWILPWQALSHNSQHSVELLVLRSICLGIHKYLGSYKNIVQNMAASINTMFYTTWCGHLGVVAFSLHKGRCYAYSMTVFMTQVWRKCKVYEDSAWKDNLLQGLVSNWRVFWPFSIRWESALPENTLTLLGFIFWNHTSWLFFVEYYV